MAKQYLRSAEGKPDRLLLYIDQWEELYAQVLSSSDKEKATSPVSDVSRFIDLLLTAARTAPVTIVGTVRADFYDPLIGHEGIRALLPTRQVLLARMSRSELESTIVGPASKVGLAFDPPTLVERILDEAGEDESVLPLLQYALKESWALRQGNTITAPMAARVGCAKPFGSRRSEPLRLCLLRTSRRRVSSFCGWSHRVRGKRTPVPARQCLRNRRSGGSWSNSRARGRAYW
jgi:hypothetical protein